MVWEGSGIIVEILGDAFAAISTALTGMASGGMFGLLGGIVGAFSKALQEKQRQNFQREQWAYEENLLRLHMEAKMEETEQELAIVTQEGSWTALDASLRSAAMIQASPWANNIRSLFRPFLTIVLVGLAAWMFDSLIGQMAEGNGLLIEYFSLEELSGLVRYMVQTIFFTASTAALWWFAERALTPNWAK